MDNEFYTFTQYMKSDYNILSASGEDYLEMIYRLSLERGFTRGNELAAALNVQPPSVTRMLKKLDSLGYIDYEKYSIVRLKKKGVTIGKFLLDRHETLENFLKMINVSKTLEEAEKIEHTLNDETIWGIKCLTKYFDDNSELKNDFTNNYILNKKNQA